MRKDKQESDWYKRIGRFDFYYTRVRYTDRHKHFLIYYERRNGMVARFEF